MRNAVKFYKFLDTEGAFALNLLAGASSLQLYRPFNLGQPPSDFIAD